MADEEDAVVADPVSPLLEMVFPIAGVIRMSHA